MPQMVMILWQTCHLQNQQLTIQSRRQMLSNQWKCSKIQILNNQLVKRIKTMTINQRFHTTLFKQQKTKSMLINHWKTRTLVEKWRSIPKGISNFYEWKRTTTSCSYFPDFTNILWASFFNYEWYNSSCSCRFFIKNFINFS